VIAAAAASGAEPSDAAAIPDSAFGPITGLPRASAAAVAEAAPQRTPNLTEIRDPVLQSAPPDRAQPKLPGAKPVVIPIATPKPVAVPKSETSSSSGSTSHRLSGYASYYCRAGSSPCTSGYPDVSGVQAYAAAGPRLRAALGSDWRGRVVTVDGIKVKLIDWCQCYKGEPNEKLLDLYYDVFARTGSAVTIRW